MLSNSTPALNIPDTYAEFYKSGAPDIKSIGFGKRERLTNKQIGWEKILQLPFEEDEVTKMN